MAKLGFTYEEECALRSLLPFDGDSAPSQRTSAEARIYREKLYVRCGLCTLRHVLTVEEPNPLNLPPCVPASVEP